MNQEINLILVGGGGFALELFSYISDEKLKNLLTNIKIKGVLDGSSKCELCKKEPSVKYLGDIANYTVQKNDFGIIAVGNSLARKELFETLNEISLPLFTYVHSSSSVASNAKIGNGVFVGPHSIISAHSIVSDNVAMNVYSGVGHGAIVGKNSVMSPYSVINGGCELGEGVFLGSRVTLNPNIQIGSYSTIDSGSIIRENISSFSIVSQRVAQQINVNRILKQKIIGP